MAAGEIVTENDLEALRPAPRGAVPPYAMAEIVGKALLSSKTKGEALFFGDLISSTEVKAMPARRPEVGGEPC
jgi:N-acetylneuraminate synthase